MANLYDVLEVSISSKSVRLMGARETEKNAEAIKRMAIMRRGGDDNFFVTVSAGKYRDGDRWSGQ